MAFLEVVLVLAVVVSLAVIATTTIKTFGVRVARQVKFREDLWLLVISAVNSRDPEVLRSTLRIVGRECSPRVRSALEEIQVDLELAADEEPPLLPRKRSP